VNELSNIRIITDSTADIPESVRKNMGIEMVPLKVHMDGETYLDYVTLEADQFYEKLPKLASLPKTSQPSPAEFLDVYKRILDEEPGVQIISIHLSSAFSGTYQSAVLAKSMLEEDADVTVIDSKSAAYGIGVLVLAAAEAAKQGKSKEEIVQLVAQIRKDTRIYFLVDTLEYLQKGGRIGKASAILGSLLNIKPILSIDQDGEIYPADKIRGQKKAMIRIVELLKEQFGDQPIRIALKYTDTRQPAEELASLIESNFQVVSLTYAQLGPVIGAHVGPGTSGIVVTPA
jgi:DegV family protein with EDD domain